MHFNDVSDKAPIQEFDVPLDRNVAEYALIYFMLYARKLTLDSYTPGQQSLATFLRQLSSSASQGVDTTRIYYVGLFGHWTEVYLFVVFTVRQILIFAVKKRPGHYRL
jgi:hypothetical protein